MVALTRAILKTLLLYSVVAIADCSRQIIPPVPVAFAGVGRRSVCSTEKNRCGRPHHLNTKHGLPRSTAISASDPNNNQNDEDDANSKNSLDEKVNSFLDTPFFDPDAPDNDNNWFANFVKNDYYNAETLYVGVILFFGVIVAQEGLRIVKYGGGGAPPGSGQLF